MPQPSKSRQVLLKGDLGYASLIDDIIKFVESRANELQPTMSQDAVSKIRKHFLTLKSHLFDDQTNYFSSHKEIMFGPVKENFNLLFKLLQNEKIPLQKRMSAIVAMAPSMEVCSGGVNTALQDGIGNLQHAYSGIRSASHRFKIQMINAVINEHVLVSHMCIPGNEIHFGNAYFNFIANEMGLKQRPDAFIKSIESEISNEQFDDCRKKIMEQLRPSRLTALMADDYLSKIRDAVALTGVDTSKPLEGQMITKAFNTTKNIAAATLDAEFGQVPFENFLISSSQNYGYQLAKQPTLIARHFMEKLRSDKLVDYGDVIRLSKGNETTGAIMLLDDMFWIDHQGDCQELELPSLLHASPFDILDNLRTQGMHDQQHFVILQSVAQHVLNDDTINTCDPMLKKWLNEFADIFTNTGAWDKAWIRPILLLAAKVDSVETLEILISADVDLSLANSDGQSALLIAAEHGHPSALQCLINGGANIEATDTIGATAMMYAAYFGRTETVSQLLANGANVDAVQPIMMNPLLHAVSRQKTDVVQLLVDGGADLEFKSHYQTTALMEAAGSGNLVITEILLKGGARVNECNNMNLSSAMIATMKGDAKMLGLLFDYGAKLTSINNDGKTVVQIAEESGQTDMLKEFLNEKMKATAESGDEIKLQSLIDAGADVNCENSDAQTPIMLAVKNGNAGVLKILIDAKAKLNQQDSNGQTGLMFAAIDGKKEALQMLLDAGADPNIVDNSGKPADMHALANFHSDALEILYKAGARFGFGTKTSQNHLWELEETSQN